MKNIAKRFVYTRNRTGRTLFSVCLIFFVMLRFENFTVEAADEMVSAIAIEADGKVLTYVGDSVEFENVVNSVETYFSKIEEGEKLVSVEFNRPLEAKEVMISAGEVKSEVEALGAIVRNMKGTTPLLMVTVVKEVAKNEEIPYGVEYRNNKELYKGIQKVKRKGQNGVCYVEGTILYVNGAKESSEIMQEEILQEPITEIVEEGTKSTSIGTGTLIVPTNGGYVSSGFGTRDGQMHKGIDIARPNTYTIVAADTGRVTFAGTDGGYGKKVIIDHGNGIETVYAHLASFTVKKGQVIEQGKRIGVMGKTGWATGVHLHFEVYSNGVLKNPTHYIKL